MNGVRELIIEDTLFQYNKAYQGEGGAIVASTHLLECGRVSFINNTAYSSSRTQVRGGAVYVNRTATFECHHCDFIGNRIASSVSFETN